ncbi:MAG: ExeM/NucH family extracellular endonuclease [Paracoccaceae bacterium]
MSFFWPNFVFGTFRDDVLTGSDRRDFVFAFSGDDEIWTGAGNDWIYAGSGDDTVDAGTGNDLISAGFGDDLIRGGAGNDRVYGGRGFDTVTYEGGIEDYDISAPSGRNFQTTVTSVSDGLTDAGRDDLFQIEALFFEADNYTFFLNGLNNAVLAGDDDVVASEDGGLDIAAADLLANDREFDGDTVAITSVDSQSASGAAVSFDGTNFSYDPADLFDTLKEGETATDTFEYTVDDGKGGTDTAIVTVEIQGVNDGPVLVVTTAVSVDENTTDVAAGVSATDVDSDTLKFSLSGADAALFQIDALSGALNFVTAPDFEAPGDAGGDNVYDVVVNVEDDLGASASQAVQVTVEDVVEMPPLVARINEFHYDNVGGDIGEFIEIRVDAGGDVSGLLVELYNGSNGTVYNTLNVADGTVSSDGDFDYYVLNLPANGLQNGSPDGLALSNAGTLVEFLSYEGSLTGIGGTADGVSSEDIGQEETSATEVGFSLQRNEDGTWRAPEENSSGGANDAPVAVTARINELHYDNVGSDTGEFIEIRLAKGEDASALVVELYNGNGGSVYNTLNVTDGTVSSDDDFDYYVLNLPANGLQNGSPDGLALSNGEGLIEFLSYEGSLVGVGGAADGVSSEDIGQEETTATEVGFSLQRNEDGTWRAPEANTSGQANDAPSGVVNARINEFHYDNDGADTGEFIEIRVDAGQDASGLLVELYNGNDGGVYNALTLPGTPVTSHDDYDYYVIELPANGLQNGAPDGLALSNDGALIEFLSYEGTLTATTGTAIGETSTDIGQAETTTTTVGFSLQRNEDGTWRAPEANTSGEANDAVIPPGELRLIHEVQGSGSASALDGQSVSLSAIVTHVVSDGYYLQEEDADADTDANTSEGIFVFRGSQIAVSVGDRVLVSGEVDEFFGATQITNVTSEVIEASNVDLPTAAQIMLSPDVAQDFEAVESMRVAVSSGTADPLTVIENFNLDRFGEITISAGRQVQGTQLFDAQTEADEVAAVAEGNQNNRLILDDGEGGSNPDEFQYIPGGAGDSGNGFLDTTDDFGDAGTTLRLGSELTADVQGVLGFGFGEYRLVVTDTLEVDETTNSGARGGTPADVGGSLQVASINVLNYFSTIDGQGTSGPGGLDPRGADSDEELARQTQKLVEAFLQSGSEVFAIQEIENNGFGAESAIQTLVDALNAAVDGSDPFAFVDPTTDAGFIGTDAITTGLIYNSDVLDVVASDFLVYEEASAASTFAIANVLNQVASSDDQLGDFQRNRPTVAATFEEKATGSTFTVASSHYKSKGDSNLDDVVLDAQAHVDGGGTTITQADIDALIADGNYDQGNGQGFWNQVRLDAAIELADWIENDFAGTGATNYLLLGDMNAYAEEDPVQYLDDDAGLVDLIDRFIDQDNAYSFVFDGQQGTLDQGFASTDLNPFVTGATEWHINADEPDLINYDNSFKDTAFFNDGVYGSSDHDPLIIGLELLPEAILG